MKRKRDRWRMNRKRKRGEKNITGIEKETKSERDRERD